MKVDDAQAALSRAKRLGAVTFSEPRREEGVTVPAIQGVGNSAIYFLDDSAVLASVWDQEFVSAKIARSSETAGLTRIDHLAQTTRYDEMLTWLLFYTSIFDTKRTL
nr:hypothetical protein [Ensifer sp. IC4062]